MKLVISYSCDDKTWAYELWRAFGTEEGYELWIDQQTAAAEEWWDSILQHIEDCDCVIYIMTQRSVDSIFCHAEIDYALALNKPVLPIMLKPSTYPTELKARRIKHHQISESMSLEDIIKIIKDNLPDVHETAQATKKSGDPDTKPEVKRPKEPQADNQSDQELEVFLLAEGAASEKNYSLAEKHYQQVIKVDPQGWGLAAFERLEEIRTERDRDREYLTIVQMTRNPSMMRGARAAARVYIHKYGEEYDPEGILSALLDIPTPPPMPRIEFPQYYITANDPAPGTRMTHPTEHKVTLVYVPAGVAKVGSDEGLYPNEQPCHEVVVANGFWLDLTPVTNAMYARFVKDNGYRIRRFWTEAGWEWVNSSRLKGPVDYDGFIDPQQPRVGVTWYEAYAYSRWRGGRLPTEAEWEWAARGRNGFKFPWGDTFDPNRVIYKDNSGGVTDKVGDGTRMAGASWVGALDMSGNNWEWVNTVFRSYPYEANDGRESSADGNSKRVLRGGSWSFFSFTLRSTFRVGDSPWKMNYSTGFRCAHSF